MATRRSRQRNNKENVKAGDLLQKTEVEEKEYAPYARPGQNGGHEG